MNTLEEDHSQAKTEQQNVHLSQAETEQQNVHLSEWELEELCEMFKAIKKPDWIIEKVTNSVRRYREWNVARTQQEWREDLLTHRYFPTYTFFVEWFEKLKALDLITTVGIDPKTGEDQWIATEKFVHIAPQIRSRLRRKGKRYPHVDEDVFHEEDVLKAFCLLPNPLEVIHRMKALSNFSKRDLKTITGLLYDAQLDGWLMVLLINGVIQRQCNGYYRLTKLFLKIVDETFQAKIASAQREMQRELAQYTVGETP